MSTAPRHTGSRVVPAVPDLLRVIRGIEARIERVAARARPETMAFVPAVASRGEPCTAAALADVLAYKAYRFGGGLYADVACGTGAASVLEVRFAVPSLGLTGAAVTTASGGTERQIRITLTMPDTWDSGTARDVIIQGRRVSGADATTLRVLRAWQR